jgi:hypothetical protein
MVALELSNISSLAAAVQEATTTVEAEEREVS